MIKIIKHEWHTVDSQYTYELTLETLQEIYPDKGKRAAKKMLSDIQNGLIDVESVLQDASNNDVDIEWEPEYDDWVSDRKGGYDITYEVQNEEI